MRTRIPVHTEPSAPAPVRVSYDDSAELHASACRALCPPESAPHPCPCGCEDGLPGERMDEPRSAYSHSAERHAAAGLSVLCWFGLVMAYLAGAQPNLRPVIGVAVCGGLLAWWMLCRAGGK